MEEIKYAGNFVKVTEEKLSGLIWERVYIKSGVQVFPFTADGKIILIEEKRPHEKVPTRLKFVTGQMDNEAEDPLETANREMQEEIGFKANTLKILLHRESSGTINNHFYQVIAKDLVASKIPNPDGEDSIIRQKAYSIDEILEFYECGKMQWSMDSLGIYRIKDLIAKDKLF